MLVKMGENLAIVFADMFGIPSIATFDILRGHGLLSLQGGVTAAHNSLTKQVNTVRNVAKTISGKLIKLV